MINVDKCHSLNRCCNPKRRLEARGYSDGRWITVGHVNSTGENVSTSTIHLIHLVPWTGFLYYNVWVCSLVFLCAKIFACDFLSCTASPNRIAFQRSTLKAEKLHNDHCSVQARVNGIVINMHKLYDLSSRTVARPRWLINSHPADSHSWID